MEAAVARAVGTGYGSATPTEISPLAPGWTPAMVWRRGSCPGCRDDGQERLSYRLPDRDDTEVSEAGAVAAAITKVSSGGQAFLRGGWGHVNRLAAVPPRRQVIAIFASLIALWIHRPWSRGKPGALPIVTIVSAPGVSRVATSNDLG
jgi:hypothetical protein